MKTVEEQQKIESKNKDIEDAVLVSQMMDHPGFEIVKRHLKNIEDKFRFQDILGIRDEALKDQKGIVVGMQMAQDYFKDIANTAMQPRRDPLTGEPIEVIKKKS